MKLGTYKGLHIRQPDLTVREEEIDNVLKREQRRNAVIIHTEEDDQVRKILVSQPIDDDFALDFSEFDSLTEWRAAIREALEEQRYISSEERIERELLARIISHSDIPIEREVLYDVADALYEDLLDGLEESGISLAHYLKRRGITEEELEEEQETEALFALQSEEVLCAIAEREGLTVLPNELADELRLMAEEDEEDPVTYADSFDDEELAEIEQEMLMEKAMDVILENTIFDE